MREEGNGVHFLLRAWLCLSVHAHWFVAAHACMFPDYLQLGDDGEPWYTHVRYDRTRELAYYIRHDELEIRQLTTAEPSVRWTCMSESDGTFLLTRTPEDTDDDYSACVRFVRRGQGLVTLLWTPETMNQEVESCDAKQLTPDPWLLVSFKLITKDYSPSPFRGGYSMRITDSDSGENVCNYVHRPMKLESDCLGGEGVLFDFTSKNCLPSADMSVRQRTLTASSWSEGGHHFVVLRQPADVVLYCLRLPATQDEHMNVFLFRDLACLSQPEHVLLAASRPRGAKYLVLHLQKYLSSNLCDDEYPQCSAVACDSHFRQECQRSCRVCDVKNPPVPCSFPRRLRGLWHQTDVDGYHHVNISESEMSIGGVGGFRCVMFPDSPARKTRRYTTLSTFSNGCRPRFSCLKFKRLGPAVQRYTLSRSVIWSDLDSKFGDAVCSDAQFVPDPEPVSDLYRSQEDGGKPIISDQQSLEGVPCNLPSSFTITATFPNGSACAGSLYEHCEDSSRLRLELHADCGRPVSGRPETFTPPRAPLHADFSCMARYDGHYWESVLLLQSVTADGDARCLVMSQLDASEAVMLVAGQCDKNSWNYARAGLRAPLLSLRLRPDELPCKYLPVTLTSTSPSLTLAVLDGSSGAGTSGNGWRMWQTQRPPDTGFTSSAVVSATLSPPQGDLQHRMSASQHGSGTGPKDAPRRRPETSPEGNDAAPRSAAPPVLRAGSPCLVGVVAACYWIAR